MADQRIVTEIIVDARQAEAGLAAIGAAQRAAQREFDKSVAKSLEVAAALKQVGKAGKDASDVLTMSSAGLNKAAAAADAYRGRLDPLVFAQNALGKELKSVEAAIFAVDAMNKKGRRTDDEAIQQVAELTVRKKELVGVLDQVRAKTINVADAMTFMKTAFERANEPMKENAANADAMRLKYDDLYRSSKQYSDAVAGILAAEKEKTLSSNLVTVALEKERLAFIARGEAMARSEGGATGGPSVSQLEATRRKYDEVYRISKQYEDAINEIKAAEDAKTISSKVATAAMEKERLAMEANIAAADKAAKAALGPDAAAQAAQYDKLRASIDPVFRLSKEYEAELHKIDEAQKIVKLSSTQLEMVYEDARRTFVGQVDALNKVKKGHSDNDDAMKKGTYSASQMKFATQQLTVQLSQMGSGLLTGQNLMTVLIQQGHQIFDVAVSSNTGWGVFGATLAKVMTPIGLTVTGITAIVGTLTLLSVNAESAARSFNQLQVSLSATRGDFGEVSEDIEKNSRRIAASLRLSREEVTSTMGAIAQLPLPEGLNSSLEDLTRTAANLGTVLGTGLAGGLKDVTAALRDPTKAAQNFANTAGGLRTLSGTLLRTIADLQEAGNKTGATNVLLLAMKEAADIAEKQGLTPLQKAMKALNEEFVKGSEGGKNFFKDLGDGINAAVVVAVNALRDLVRAINQLYELQQKMPQGVAGALGSSIPGVGMVMGAYTTGSALYDTLFNRGNGTGGLVGTPSAQTQALVAQWQKDPMAVRSALSSANAIGIGQLMPGTAADLQVNPMVPFQNVRGMMTYIQQLSKTFATQPDIAAHYLTGPAGAGLGSHAGQKYASETMGRNPGAVPKETADMIEYWGNALGMSREMIDFGKRIAMQENRGMQGPLSVMRPYIDPTSPTSVGGSVKVTTVSPTDIDPNTGKPRVGADEQTDRGRIAAKAYGAEVVALTQKQRDLDKALGEGAITAEQHAVATAQNTLALARARDKTMDANRATQEGLAVSKQATEADAAMLRNRQAMQDQMRNDPTITQAQATERLAQQEAGLAESYNRTVIELDKKLKADDLEAIAQSKSVAAVGKAAAAQQAVNEANKSFVSNSPAHAAAVANLTQKYLESASAQQKIALEKEHTTNKETIGLIEEETKALHMQADEGALYLQHKKNELAVSKEYWGLSPERQAAALKERDAIAMLNQELSNQRAIGQYLAGQFDTMFSTIGNAISQAFVQGQGAAVNFGNVAKAVVTQLKQAFLQLAFINPIKQMFMGSSIASSPTLLNVIGYLAGGGAGGGMGSGAVTDDTSGRSTNGVGGSLSSLASGAGTIAELFGLKSGLGGAVNGALGGPGTSLFATSAGSLWATPAAGAGSIWGSGSLAAAGPGVTTLGGAAAGIGGGLVGGFLAGSLAGGAIQGARGTTGPAPYIGAGLGALAGTVGGFLIGGPLGAVLGGIGGGLVGGGAGGFIGPKKASPFSSTLLGITEGGHASVGATVGQGVNTAAEREALIQDVNKLNDFLDSTGLKLTDLGKIAQIGQNSPKGVADPSKFANLSTGFDQLRFSSQDPNLNKYLTGRSFGDSAALQTAITNYRTLVDTTIPTLMSFGKTTGTVTDAIKQLNDAFNAAITGSNEFGLATEDLTRAQTEALAKINDAAARQINDFDTTLQIRKMTARGADPQGIELMSFDQGARQQRDAFKAQMVGLWGDAYTKTRDFADQMALLEETLGAERFAIVKRYADQITEAWKAVHETDKDLFVRISNASPGDAMTKELYSFDINADRQRKQFSDQLINSFGDTFMATQSYADQMALLETALGAERVAIVQKYNDEITAKTDAAAQAAAGSIQSLVAYAQGLRTSDASPLSQQDQLTLARNRFNAVAGAAGAGDYNSIQQLQGYSESFLSASRNVYGSGEAYAADFQRVLEALGQVANVMPDTLTASVLATETRTQTAELVGSLAELRAAVDNITTQLRQNATAPARIAA